MSTVLLICGAAAVLSAVLVGLRMPGVAAPVAGAAGDPAQSEA